MDGISELIKSSAVAQFGLLLVMTLFACSKVTIQSRACRRHLRNIQDSLLYNIMFFSSTALTLLAIFPLAKPNLQIILMAAIHGVLYTVFQVMYSIALLKGPISLTVLIVNFGVFIPTALSVFGFGESFYFTQLIGLLFLVAAMLLNFQKSHGGPKVNKLWMALTIMCLIINGAIACVCKVFFALPDTQAKNSDNTFLVFTYLIAAIIAIVIYFVRANIGEKEKSTFWFSKSMLLYSIAIGVIIGFFQKLYAMGVANIDGAIMFPTYSGLQSISMTAIGIVMFKDHLTTRQWIGAICGIISIILINVKLWVLF